MTQQDALEAIRSLWERLPRYTKDWTPQVMEDTILEMSHYAKLGLEEKRD